MIQKLPVVTTVVVPIVAPPLYDKVTVSPLRDPVPEKNGSQLVMAPLVGVTIVAVPVDGVITNVDASATNDRENSNNAPTTVAIDVIIFLPFS